MAINISTATTAAIATCRCISSVVSTCCAPGCVLRTRMPHQVVWTSCNASWIRSAHVGQRHGSSFAQTRVSAVTRSWPGARPTTWAMFWVWRATSVCNGPWAVKQHPKLTSYQRAILTRLRGLIAVFEPVGFIAGFDNVAVMGDAVEHGSRHLGIGKDLHPFGEGQIGGDDQTGAFIELAD